MFIASIVEAVNELVVIDDALMFVVDMLKLETFTTLIYSTLNDEACIVEAVIELVCMLGAFRIDDISTAVFVSFSNSE